MSFEILIATFVTLFVLIDPIALAPLFVALTQGQSAAQRRHIAVRALLIAFGMLLVFGLAGEPLLTVIGIGMPAFRISGGLLLFLMAVDMLFEKRSERREKRANETLPDPSVFPLATPLIAGPGSLAAMILLCSQNSGNWVGLASVIAVLILVLVITFFFFRLGQVIERLLGHTGIVVITRLFGILLAALSVQFVLDGLRDLGVMAG